MLPLELFRVRQFSGANAVTFAVYGALGGALFLLPIELQLVAHYSPLDSGLALLPLTVVMLVFSARSGELSARIGPRLQMTLGPFVVGAGLVLLTRATEPGSYLTQVLPAVAALRRRPGHRGRPADRDGDGRRAGRALGHRLCGQQHRGPGGGAPRRGPAAAALGPHRCRRAGSHGPGHRFPDRHAHLGRRQRRRRRHRRADHPQPGPHAATGGAVQPHLPLRRRQPAAPSGPHAGGHGRGRA